LFARKDQPSTRRAKIPRLKNHDQRHGSISPVVRRQRFNGASRREVVRKQARRQGRSSTGVQAASGRDLTGPTSTFLAGKPHRAGAKHRGRSPTRFANGRPLAERIHPWKARRRRDLRVKNTINHDGRHASARFVAEARRSREEEVRHRGQARRHRATSKRLHGTWESGVFSPGKNVNAMARTSRFGAP